MTYLWKERETGKFVRTLRLPTALEEGKVEATYQDGILTVKAAQGGGGRAQQDPHQVSLA